MPGGVVSSSSGTADGGWAVWITGLPGSGKSTVADMLAATLRKHGMDVRILRMDEQRKKYVPDPQYTSEERENAYRLFVRDGAAWVRTGVGVIMDATAHRLRWRTVARREIPCFAEIHLRVPLETAMAREAERPQGAVMAGLYAKALERRDTGTDKPGLGDVVGVDVPFEEDPKAECVLDNTVDDPGKTVERILLFLLPWLRALGKGVSISV